GCLLGPAAIILAGLRGVDAPEPDAVLRLVRCQDDDRVPIGDADDAGSVIRPISGDGEDEQKEGEEASHEASLAQKCSSDHSAIGYYNDSRGSKAPEAPIGLRAEERRVRNVG